MPYPCMTISSGTSLIQTDNKNQQRKEIKAEMLFPF